jgi:hypothetical protein
MNKVVALVVFVLVSGAMYGLCANAHIDFFPCEEAELQHDGGPFSSPRLVTHEGTCSFMAHLRGTGPDGEYERLTGAGWALLVVFCESIGLVAGGLAGYLTRKRS